MIDLFLNAAIFLITLYIVVMIFFRKDHCWNLQRGRYTWHFETYNFELPDDFVIIAKEHYLDHVRERRPK